MGSRRVRTTIGCRDRSFATPKMNSKSPGVFGLAAPKRKTVRKREKSTKSKTDPISSSATPTSLSPSSEQSASLPQRAAEDRVGGDSKSAEHLPTPISLTSLCTLSSPSASASSPTQGSAGPIQDTAHESLKNVPPSLTLEIAPSAADLKSVDRMPPGTRCAPPPVRSDE